MRKPKANRAYSLDVDTIVMLEKYCASHEYMGGKRWSRSMVVNNAIKYFIGRGLAEKLESAERMKENFNKVCIEKAELEAKLRDTDRFDLN